MINSVLKINEEIKFWRTKAGAEVDFVVETNELIPVECKFQEMGYANIPSGMRAFIQNYKPKAGIVITKDYFDKVRKDKTTIYFIPAWAIG